MAFSESDMFKSTKKAVGLKPETNNNISMGEIRKFFFRNIAKE